MLTESVSDEQRNRKDSVVDKRGRRVAAVTAVVLTVASGAVVYHFRQRCLPRFVAVRPGVLYRSGQPRGPGLLWLRLRGIRTLVNLRSPGSDGMAAEERFARLHGLAFHNVCIGHTAETVGAAADQFLRIVRHPRNWPVLVHCSRGKERSGVLSAVFRLECEQWPNREALAEMYRLGVTPGTLEAAEDFVRSYGGAGSLVASAAPRRSEEPDAYPRLDWQE